MKLAALLVFAGVACAHAPRAVPPPTPRRCEPDAKNCGACGHSCLGGACVAGACEKFVVAHEPGEGGAIVSTRSFVAWSAYAGIETSIRARVWDGKDVATVGGHFAIVPRLVATDEHVYWCEVDHIARAAVRGGEQEEFAKTGGDCRALAADRDRVAWSTPAGEVIVRSPLQTPARRLAKLATPPFWLSIAGKHVFTDESGGTIALPLDGGPRVAIADTHHVPTAAGNDLFVIESYAAPKANPDEPSHALYAIARTSFAAGAPPTRLVDDQINPSDLTVVGEDLYWLDGGIYENPIVLRRVPIAGGAVADALTLPPNAGLVSLGPTAIVWQDRESHTIYAQAL